MTTPKLRCIEGRLPKLNTVPSESLATRNTHLSGVCIAWAQGTEMGKIWGPWAGESDKACQFNTCPRRHGFPKAGKF